MNSSSVPFLDEHLVLRPGGIRGLKIPHHRYLELEQAAATDGACPGWLVAAARTAWADVDLAGRRVSRTVLIRATSPQGYGRASYELGMMISVSTNGSRLHSPRVLDLHTARRPYRITVSVYGATEASYDSLTRRRGSYRQFIKGLYAACEAGLPINLNLIVTTHNAEEHDGMVRLVEDRGLPHHTFSNMSPTIYGGAESLPAQSAEHLRKRKPFTGCNRRSKAGRGHLRGSLVPHVAGDRPQRPEPVEEEHGLGGAAMAGLPPIVTPGNDET